jgi:hypothetical protein
MKAFPWKQCHRLGHTSGQVPSASSYYVASGTTSVYSVTLYDSAFVEKQHLHFQHKLKVLGTHFQAHTVTVLLSSVHSLHKYFLTLNITPAPAVGAEKRAVD